MSTFTFINETNVKNGSQRLKALLLT